MASTYKLIATASGTSTGYSFTNIPQNYEDLRIVTFARSTNGANAWIGMSIGFNNTGQSTDVIYRRYIMYNSGGGVSNSADTSAIAINANGTNTTAGTYGVGILYIKGYSNTDKYKPWGAYTSNTTNSTAYLSASVSGQYRSNSAITSIEFDAGSGYGFETAGKFYLYGIATS